LPQKLSDYLNLLDWSGRQLKADKRGAISSDLPPILERLGINGAKWLKLVTDFDRLFTSVVGRTEKILKRAEDAGRRWYHGQVACREAFG
jgi:hypothetical protein